GVDISDSICDLLNPQPLQATEIEPPTLTMMFSVNDSPFCGKEGKYVTSRNLRERLFKELESNVALKVEESEEKGAFKVSGRGLLHLGILIENMRREGYELSISKPHVIMRKDKETGALLEPIEYLVVDVPEKNMGGVMELVGNRKGELVRMDNRNGQVHLEFTIPARGLIGLRTRMLTATQGEAIMHHNFHEYAAARGNVPGRPNGVMVSMTSGVVNAFTTPLVMLTMTPFGRPGTLPRAAAYSWKLWCMIASPCVAVSMRVRSPMRPRAGMVNSRCTWPLRLSMRTSSPLRLPTSSITPPMFFSGTSTTRYSIGSSSAPVSLSFRMITCGLLIDSSYPSRRMFSMRMPRCSNPRPLTLNAPFSSLS